MLFCLSFYICRRWWHRMCSGLYIKWNSSKTKITTKDGSYFVSFEIQSDHLNKAFFIHQASSIEGVVRTFNMCNAKSQFVPSNPYTVLKPAAEDVNVNIDVPHRSAVSSLNFLAVLMRPDIAFIVSTVSKFLNRYSLSHRNAVKRNLDIVSSMISSANNNLIGIRCCLYYGKRSGMVKTAIKRTLTSIARVPSNLRWTRYNTKVQSTRVKDIIIFANR